MKLLTYGALFAAALVSATPALAASITHQDFSVGAYEALTAKAVAIESFENDSTLSYTFEGGGDGNKKGPAAFGELSGSIGTAVGTFGTFGSGIGSGTTCRTFTISNATCSFIALQDKRSLNGQGNIISRDGGRSLNSNDTLGMVWDVVLPGNAMFTSVAFAIRDAADVGATLSVSVDGAARIFSNGANDNRQLWHIDFGKPMSSARIVLANSKTNDAFTLDGAAVMAATVPVVPLPAAGMLLLSALGVAVGVTRRRKAS